MFPGGENAIWKYAWRHYQLFTVTIMLIKMSMMVKIILKMASKKPITKPHLVAVVLSPPRCITPFSPKVCRNCEMGPQRALS